MAALLAATALLAVPALAQRVHGTAESDHLHGGSKPDRISGRAGDDRLSGRGADDVVRGGRGGDTLVGGAGFDTLLGGPEDDVIRARDGEEDQIECGDGTDRVYVDVTEAGVFDCEEVIEP
jgi:Ca2+-binding RTX toxin-like protein